MHWVEHSPKHWVKHWVKHSPMHWVKHWVERTPLNGQISAMSRSYGWLDGKMAQIRLYLEV